ncbi:serine hydrolase domain-containing protein [Spongiimicrobium sp. 3-5]|uniref:serine hydrolase domain-containing protein n=1 Tax=Spongiimicrobium sp. 3-5 TaxID=3332596 RepID=UPI00397FFE27
MKKWNNHFIFILIGILFVFSNLQAQSKQSNNLDLSLDKGLTYGLPSDVGLDSSYIRHRVDSIMTHAIRNNAFPGAQLLVAKDRKIIFHEAFGFHTYDSIQKVALDDIYDLASVTKITGPLPALMKLHDEGKLDLDAPFSTYWEPWSKAKDKKDLTLREILSHQAGLEPYIVFLDEVIKNGKIKRRYIRPYRKRGFENKAYDNLYIKTNFYKKVNRAINKSEVSNTKKYKYSGLSFLIYPQLIKQLTGVPYDEFVGTNFYTPLGCSTLGFNPSTKNYPNTIVPTEVDTLFRKTLTQGWVHDENAALLGGISGNAGLFGTATDLARLMQMYANGGSYAGKRYLSEKTVNEFTKIQYPENENRRGLGFDKPLLNNMELPLEDAYPAPEASAESFGHSGFTGTFVWADPKNQLVFIFLSNRVYPTRENRNLYALNVRSALHQVFYKAALSQ